MQANRARLSVYPQSVLLLIHRRVVAAVLNRCMVLQSHSSNRYYQHPIGLRRCERDNTTECPEGLGDTLSYDMSL